MIDYICITITYLRFYYACQAQGLDRKTLPYYGYFQPYSTWFALCVECVVCLTFGYGCFRVESGFSVSSFFSSYTLVIIDPILFIGWKIIKKTKPISKYEVDLVWERPTIDAYEATFIDPPVGFWREMVQLVGLWKVKGGNDRRQGSISN